MTRTLIRLAAGLLLSAALGAFAQDPCLKAPGVDKADAVFSSISAKRGFGCYDVKAHPLPQFEGAVKLLDKASADSVAGRQRTLAAMMELIREWLKSKVSDAQLSDAMQLKVADAKSALSQAQPGPTWQSRVEAALPSNWRVEEQSSQLRSKALGNQDIAAPLRGACDGTAARASACTAAIDDVELVLRAHAMVEAATSVAQKEAFADYAALFEKRAQMWEAYRTEARPQYPWEWLANGVLYKDKRPRDSAGNPLGPAYLPGSQLILVHPGVGLERFDVRGSSQTQNNPTLYVEWIGYNGLNWDYDGGKLAGGLGVSFLSAYAPRQDGVGKWTRGIMFWSSNKYGLAVTRNDQGTSIMLSIEAADLYRGTLNRLNEALDSALK